MPKIKTKSGAKKRFSITGTGKIRVKGAGRRHILEHKTSAQKKRLKKYIILSGSIKKQVKRLIPTM
ncbi:MAG: 50S ribosomal protein L35 [Deltaproteobacteria bacterium]|jgi:large subunit ribosomal protein L35|nr:50S ribosomal protein L35 [Deltaproteobacteria bacterium]MCL5792269.1 50S ribosomal protein L35 [Deltaproteobacteria bacterium]